ncbi:MAG: response regulator transcription factor [Acidobacteria bacterium]|nr:response regulator transcription factor [Acidobacteriota bacterium]
MKGSSRIRVLIADDHPLVRAGIVAAIGEHEDMEVVGEAASGAEAMEQFRSRRPDVLLLDLSMPVMEGLEALDAIRSEFPKARIIVLTVRDGDEDIRRAMDGGACGYLLKNTSPVALGAAVRSVHGGLRLFPDEVLMRLGESRVKLTERETVILQLIARGFSNREIGGLLSITEGTVKTHVVSILAKLSARDRTEAVTIGLQRGILHIS